MALDPSISLAVRPPDIPPLQIVNPVQQFGQILSLRNLMTQGQSGQLELQSQALKLQQMQREMQEQQDYANFLKQSLNPGGTALPAPAAGPPPLGAPQAGAGAIAPQPQTGAAPGGGPLDTSMIAPDFRLQGQSLNTLMTPPAAAPALAPAAPPVAAPAPVAQDGAFALPGGLSAGQFIARFPLTGGERLKQTFGLQQTQAEAAIKQHDANMGKADELGRIAISIRDSKDPATQFTPGIMDAVGRNLLPAPIGRQMLADGWDKHKNDIDAFIAQAQNAKDYSETQKNNLAASLDKRKLAIQDYANVNDQGGHAQFLARYPELQPVLGDAFSPEVKDAFQNSAIPAADVPKTVMAQRAADAQVLGALIGRNDGGAAFNKQLADWGPKRAAPFVGLTTPQAVLSKGLTPEQSTTAAQAAATLAQTTTRDTLANKRDQERIAAENRRIQIDQQKADAEYGPGTIGAAVSQIYANPDSVDKFLTPSNAGAIAQAFNDKYHLPLPTPLKGTSLDQETASKNTIADIDWIRNALKNPNIAKNIGPILGRLQNVEQATGAAVLTGADAEQAQELRSRMRTMLANEAAAMHARINPNTLNDLANSSGRVDMDAKMLSGALNGVEGFATTKLNGAERQRFGGQMRPPEARGIAPPPAALPPPPKSGDIITGKGGTKYLFLGGDPKDKSNYAPYTPVAH